MSRNNDVFKVLVAKTAMTRADQPLDSLVPGQIGVFNSETNLSVNTANPPKEFYLAVGVDNSGSGTLEDINKSAGQMIQRENIRYYNGQPYTPGQPEVVEISDFIAKCDTEFAIKLEFRNQKIYNLQGYNQFSKTYVVQAPCCGGECDPCPPADGNELVKLFVNSINADKDGLVIAEAIDPTSNTVIADLDTFIATNKTVNTDDDFTNDVVAKIRLTTQPLNVYRFCDINLMYFKPRETVLIASLTAGFDCAGTVTVVQDVTFEQGSGYDVRQREYKAGGWNGRPGPYRVSELNGVASSGFRYFSETTKKYHRVNLTYDLFSIGGWQEFLNNVATEIYFEEADVAALTDFLGVLEAVLPTGFESQISKF